MIEVITIRGTDLIMVESSGTTTVALNVVAKAMMDILARPKPSIVLVEHLENLVACLLDVASRHIHDIDMQSKMLAMLAADHIVYTTTAAQRTVETVLAVWSAFPGNKTLSCLGLRALCRGRRRQQDYLPLERFPDLLCTPSQVVEMIRLSPVHKLPELTVALSFCPTSVLRSPGVIDNVLRFAETITRADPLALYVVLDRAEKQHQLRPSLWPGSTAAAVPTDHPDALPILKYAWKWGDIQHETGLRRWVASESNTDPKVKKWATRVFQTKSGV
jgi:hypothetical protein